MSLNLLPLVVREHTHSNSHSRFVGSSDEAINNNQGDNESQRRDFDCENYRKRFLFSERSRRSRGASLRGPSLKKSPIGHRSGVTEHARCRFPTEPEGFASSALLCVTFLLMVPRELPRPPRTADQP